jgi:hypothetical protein
MVCIQTLATLAGIETSEKNAAGPPGWFLRMMNPSMRRWKPNETWVVENKNMKMAVVIIALPILRCFRLYREIKRYEKNKTMFIP